MESLLENMIGSRHLKLTVLSEWFQYRLLGDLGLGSVAEVFLARWKLFGEDSFWEKFFGFLFRDGWKDHHAISILPVHWGGDPLLRCQLERDNYAENLIEVPAGGGWVEDRQLQFLIRTKHKHHTGSHRHALFVLLCWVQHAQQDGKLPILIINDGEG